MKTARFGSISSGTLREEDLIPAFVDALRDLRGALPRAIAQHYASWHSLVHGSATTRGDADAAALCDELQDALQEYAPDYGYFGAHPGDGADFGFWLSEDWQQQARNDGVKFVSDLSEVPDSFRGRVCVVNDHGNATLYATRAGVGTLREVWSVV